MSKRSPLDPPPSDAAVLPPPPERVRYRIMPLAFREILALVLLFQTMSPKLRDPVLVMTLLPIIKTASSLAVGIF
jgi:hypothetical protein